MRIHWIRMRRYVFGLVAIVIVAIYPGHDAGEFPKSFDKALIVRRPTGPFSDYGKKSATYPTLFHTVSEHPEHGLVDD